MVLPGEVAPAHRHAQSALRFVLEGEGGRTAVNGERTEMHYGDFIITPPMAWHDHSNESGEPILWLDGLDIPIVQFLDASFADHHHNDEQPISRPVGDSHARFGSNLLPIDQRPATGASPIFNYPYERTREVLTQLARTGPCDPCHGLKMRYSNPLNGGYALSTIGAFIQLLPKGFETTPYRSTDATVFVAVEGRGRTRIGDDFVVEWQARDIFVVPSWKYVVHEAPEEAVLFSFSDRPIQEGLCLFREDRGSV
jgi:gentisate 1,2-dioxygenase